MKKRATNKGHRVQIDMPEASYRRLERLKDITEASSYAEVVRNSLRLYEAIISEHELGSEFLIKRDNETVKYQIFSA